MAKNEVRDNEGNLICYLNEYKNGGIDLYDEYNKGVDKIIDAFKGCAEKQRKVEAGGQGKEDALAQNEREKQEKIEALRGQKEAEIAKIDGAIEDCNRKIQEEERKYNEFVKEQERTAGEQHRRLENATQREKEDILDEYTESIVRKRRKGGEISAVYSVARNNMDTERQRLQSDLVSHKERCGQINHKISELEKSKKPLRSDESIEREVENYAGSFDFARQTFYEKNQSGAFRNAAQLDQSMKQFNREAVVQTRTRDRLQKEGLLPFLEGYCPSVKDQAEAERCSKDKAKCAVIGLDSRLADSSERLKRKAMALFCYPRTFLSNSKDSSWDWIALLIALPLLAELHLPRLLSGMNFPKLSFWQCMKAWFVVWVAAQVICGILKVRLFSWKTGSGLSIFIKIMFYPVFVFLFLRNIKVCLIWALICGVMYFRNDVLFRLRMLQKRFQESYRSTYEASKAAYLEELRKVEEAPKKQKEYYEEESAHVRDEIRQAEEKRDQLRMEGEKEREALYKKFKDIEWPRMLEERRGQLLSERKSASDWNLRLEKEISDEKSALRRLEEETAQLNKEVMRVDSWSSVLGEEWNQLWRRIDQSVDQSIEVLKGYCRTYLKYDDWQIKEKERYVKSAEMPSVRREDVGRKKLGIINWVQTEEQRLQEQYEEAKKELDALWKEAEEEFRPKEPECEQKLKAAEESCQGSKRTVTVEADRRKEEARKRRDDEVEKLRRASSDNSEKVMPIRTQWDQKIKEAKNYYQEEATRIDENWVEEIKRLEAAYKEELNSLLEKLHKDGLAEICGFNYKWAWRVFHGMATNIFALPIVMKEEDDKLLNGLTAKAISSNFEYCQFMPEHLLWGYSPVKNDFLTPGIIGRIGDALRQDEEFKGSDWSDGDRKAYRIEETPTDIFYKLDCTPVKDGPAMIFYDLGDLKEDRGKRERLMDFIRRVFIFDIQQCVGAVSHLKCRIVSMEYEEYFTAPAVTACLGDQGEVATQLSDAKKMIKELREMRERLSLGNGETLHEKNKKLSKEKEKDPSDDYEVLIVVNSDYSGLVDSDLGMLLRISAGTGKGMYSFLFVDMNDIKRMDTSEKERVKETIQNIKNNIGRDGSFYEICEWGDRLMVEEMRKEDADRMVEEV